jgi:vacuolar protein sorting-associated protein 13A/C
MILSNSPSRYPESGGAFKVQIYCPYVVLNKSGMPFHVRTARSNRSSSPLDVAGDARPGMGSRDVEVLLIDNFSRCSRSASAFL